MHTVFTSYISKLEIKEGCWGWKAGKISAGYGNLRVRDKLYLAHRVSYCLFVGDIPSGMFVCHACDNPECTNPEHLFLGTNADNMQDKVQKNRQSKGSKNGGAKLHERDIPKIRSQYPQKTLRQLATEFNVSVRLISKIVKMQNWTHV